MNKRISGLVASAALAALASFTSGASAAVLTFDDIGADGVVPANYGGLDWSASDWFAFGETQVPYTPHSGDYRAISGFGDADLKTAVRFGAPSTFEGAWFSGLEGATVTFELFEQGALVAVSATLDPSATPRFLASGYQGLVDEVIVASPGQGSFAMDDFTFTQAVPEPQSLALMFAGLGVVGVVARRRMGRR